MSETPEQDDEKERKERAIRFALGRVESALLDLASNLLRIIRSHQGGKPWLVAREAGALLVAFKEYSETAGHLPPAHDISNALALRQVSADDTIVNEVREWDSVKAGEDEIICGALQVVASRLLGQSTQETRGHHEMLSGIHALTKARRERDEEFERTKGQRLAAFRAMIAKKPKQEAGKPTGQKAAKGKKRGD